MPIYLLLWISLLSISISCKKGSESSNLPGTGSSLPPGDSTSLCQAPMKPDGNGDVYGQINRYLGGTAVEVPDCSHPEFGTHIREEFDEELKQLVFSFLIHVSPDNDRCINFDRQRVEIKTYDQSPNKFRAFLNDTMLLHWKFKLDKDFQPSKDFTHIHQLKPFDGDAANPIITTTLRYKQSGDQLEVVHYGSDGKRTVLKTILLAPLKGRWVEAEEMSVCGSHGSYKLVLKDLFSGEIILSYANNDLDMWRSGTTFVRPKWGIYRSLKSKEYLRDEKVLFTDFCIQKFSK